MVEAILAADGVTPDLLALQTARAALLETLMQAPSEAALAELALAHDAELDRTFFELLTARMQLNAHGIVLSEYAPGEANTPIVDKRPVLPTPEHRATMIQTEDCAEALYFIASQAHSMSVIQLPAYQPFGGMPPQISAPWLAGLDIKAK